MAEVVKGMSKDRERLLRELEAENRRSTTGAVLFLQAVTQRSGMNPTDLQCINILRQAGPITAGQLAETVGLTAGAVTGAIDRMERAGYVRREKDPEDGRRVLVRPVLEELERAGAGVFGSHGGRALEALVPEYDERDLAVVLDFMRRANDATEEEVARVRSGSRGDEGGEFATPLGPVEGGRLVLASGAYRLTLRAVSGTGDLYRARFEGTPPKVEAQGGTVTFRYPRRFQLFGGWRERPEEVALNPTIPWKLEVRGGAARTRADLSGLELSSFFLKGGATDFDLTLPEPSGVVPIRLSGGASKVSIRRPAGTEARLSLKGGAATLTFDGQSFDALGGTVRLQSPGYEGARDRYEIEVSGGAIELTVR